MHTQDKIKKAPHIEETTHGAARVHKLEPEHFYLIILLSKINCFFIITRVLKLEPEHFILSFELIKL